MTPYGEAGITQRRAETIVRTPTSIVRDVPRMLEPALTKQLFIAWVPFARRQVSMAPLLGLETVFLPIRQIARVLRPFQYVTNALRTLSLLKAKRPGVIWVQLPQVPLLTVALQYKRMFDPSVRIIADCHNRILNSPWNSWPGLKAQLNSCDAVVVHNTKVMPKVSALGVRQDLLRLLEDPPAAIRSDARATRSYPHPWMLFLASFNPDEPVEELLEVARLAPDIHFVLAGDANRAAGRHDIGRLPENVVLPGYLTGADLDSAIASADAILALTKLDDAQLSSAGEAIGAGRPMVLSDTPVTRDLYYQGGVFVDTYSPASILKGCRAAIEGGARLAAESLALRDERYARWRSQAESIHEVLAI
jgi:glycosyltransferase involved in cell wall biosynthesis